MRLSEIWLGSRDQGVNYLRVDSAAQFCSTVTPASASAACKAGIPSTISKPAVVRLATKYACPAAARSAVSISSGVVSGFAARRWSWCGHRGCGRQAARRDGVGRKAAWRVDSLYDFAFLFDVVTITGFPVFISRAGWVNPSSELLRIEMLKPATRIPAMRATTTTFRWVVRSAP